MLLWTEKRRAHPRPRKAPNPVENESHLLELVLWMSMVYPLQRNRDRLYNRAEYAAFDAWD